MFFYANCQGVLDTVNLLLGTVHVDGEWLELVKFNRYKTCTLQSSMTSACISICAVTVSRSMYKRIPTQSTVTMVHGTASC